MIVREIAALDCLSARNSQTAFVCSGNGQACPVVMDMARVVESGSVERHDSVAEGSNIVGDGQDQ